MIKSEKINLGQISNIQFVNKFFVQVVIDQIEIKGSIEPAGTVEIPKYVRIFYSDNENVSSTNYSYYSDEYSVTANFFEIVIPKGELIDEGFDSGTTVYLKIYGDSYWNNSYENPATGEMTFPNLSTSSPDPVSFVVP